MDPHDTRWTRQVIERLRRVMPGLHGTLPRFFVYGVQEEGADLRAALRAAEAALANDVRGRTAVVVSHEGEHESPIVVLRLPRFLDLVMEWWQGQVHQASTRR